MTRPVAAPRAIRPALAALLALGLASCASSSLSLAPETAETPHRGGIETSEAAPAVVSADRGPDFGLPPDPSMPIDLPRPAIEKGHVHSLPELIDIAEATNPTTRSAWERARQAALAVGMAKATYLPILSADVVAGWERTSNPAAGFEVGTPPTGFTVPPGTVTAQGRQVMPSATVKWLLFDFGGRAATVEAANQASIAANVGFNGTHQKLIWDVSRAFHRYTAARAQLAIARQTLANTKALREAAEARLARGIGTSIEVAQARQQVAQAELALTQSTGSVRDVYRGLLEAMGVAPTLEIAVEDVGDRPLPKAPSGDLDRLVEASLQRRPDVQAAFARLKADRAGIDKARSDLLPKVGLTGTLARDYGSYSLSDSRLSTTAQHSAGATNAGMLLGVTIPIYDGGLRDAQLKAAESRAAAAEQELAKLQNEAAKEIVVAYDTLRTSLSAHAAASELVAASTVTAKAAREYYRNGMGSLSDATAAETALLQARIAKAKAHADALISASTIAFATGTLTNRLSPPH